MGEMPGETMTHEGTKKNAGTRTRAIIVGSIALLTLFVVAAPSASAISFVGGDRCNGTTEVNGCDYRDPSTGEIERCEVWVNGWCYVGG